MKFVAKFTKIEQSIDAKFVPMEKSIDAKFVPIEQLFDTKFSNLHSVTEYIGEPYEGEYSATPKVEAQTIPTKDKILVEDLTIRAIPYAEVTNHSNGKTVTIA